MATITLTLPTFHPGQQRILDESRRFNVAVCGRRWGKSLLGIDLLLQPALDGYPVAWFAPFYKSLLEVWREVKEITRPITARTDVQQHRLELVTGGVIEFWSLDTDVGARGRRYKRSVIDEAAQVPSLEDDWQQVIRPTLTDFRGDGWFLSTPKGFNFFHTLYERGQDPRFPEYASWQMPTTANPLLDPLEIEAARLELPESVFNQEYLASFVDDAQAIFNRDWWRGQNRYDATDLGIVRQCIGRWISFDTALKDKDSSAYTACTVGELTPDYRLVIREVWRSRLQFPDLPPAIEHIARRYNVDGKLRAVIVEDKSSGISALQTLRASAEPWLTEKLIAFQPRGDKPTRANQAGVWCKLGGVLLPHPSEAVPWLLDFENEIFSFPQSKFADMTDSFSQLILYLERLLAEGLHARGKAA